MKTKIFFLIGLSSFVLVFLAAPLRLFVNFQTSTLVGFICFFVLTLYCIKMYRTKLPDYLILAAILSGICIIEIPLRITNFESTLISLPDFIIHCLGIIAGFIYMISNRIIGVSAGLAALAIAVFMFFSGYDLWLNKINYGTFTGIVTENTPEIKISDSHNQVMTNETFRNKIVVLDFWNTACGVCFKKFPSLQEKYDTYKNTEGVEIYAINLNLKRDTLNQAINTIRRLNYSFPVLVVYGDTLAKKFNITGVPATIVIQNEKIVYRGDIEGVDKVLEKFRNSHNPRNQLKIQR